MGYLLVNIQLPDSASLERTAGGDRPDQQDRARRSRASTPRWASPASRSLLNAFGSNFGTMFITLKGFDKRRTPDLYYEAIANKLREQLRRRDPRGRRS